jgi:hypothetical protein
MTMSTWPKRIEESIAQCEAIVQRDLVSIDEALESLDGTEPSDATWGESALRSIEELRGAALAARHDARQAQRDSRPPPTRELPLPAPRTPALGVKT